jgi:16S rRNA (adenine1518-N6/adenine1519-N6)-dimethyltransferase
VEKDYVLAEKLDVDMGALEEFQVRQGDVLSVNLDDLVREARAMQPGGDDKKVKVVANLPYYITTDLLKQLLPRGELIESLVLLLQDEVAQRLTSLHPGTQHLSLLCIRFI